MMKENFSNFRAETATDSITLYWERPEGCFGTQYQVFLGETLVGSTKKTHYTISELKADTPYKVTVKGVYELKTDSEQKTDNAKNETDKVQQQTITVQTAKRTITIDITKEPYNAANDGATLNTKAIQSAIDDCPVGGCVYIPAGVFMTGALRLHSDMELYLEGAILQGTANPEDYLPRIWSRFEGTEMECYSSLLNLGALDPEGMHRADYDSTFACKNVAIRGKGTIASGGRVLAERIIASETENLKDYLASLGDKIKECEKPETIPARVRPRLINMSNCQNVELAGVTLRDGACWNIHMIYCDHVVTHGCTFYSHGIWNGDGWDPDSSSDCVIFNCVFNTGDDSVSIKSGKNPQGNEVNIPTKGVRVFDCRCTMGHGITIGSEMSGGVEDVRIWDCDMEAALCGFEIKGTAKRSGYVKEIHVYDSVFPRVLMHSVGYNDDGIAGPDQPYFSDCTFDNLRLTGIYQDHEAKWHECDAIELCGFDKIGHEIKRVKFTDIRFGKEKSDTAGHISIKRCEDVSLNF